MSFISVVVRLRIILMMVLIGLSIVDFVMMVVIKVVKFINLVVMFSDVVVILGVFLFLIVIFNF